MTIAVSLTSLNQCQCLVTQNHLWYAFVLRIERMCSILRHNMTTQFSAVASKLAFYLLPFLPKISIYLISIFGLCESCIFCTNIFYVSCVLEFLQRFVVAVICLQQYGLKIHSTSVSNNSHMRNSILIVYSSFSICYFTLKSVVRQILSLPPFA